MKKPIAIILGLFIIFAGLGACSMISSVDAGYVGVKVNRMGYEKGVDTKVVGTGWHFLTPNETLYKFPTFTQNKTWSGKETFTFQSEGMILGSDIGISYSIDPAQAAGIFQKYRRGIDEITDTYIRNMVRDALANESSKMKVDKVYGEEKETLIQKVEERVRNQVQPIGINVERIYWVGALELPDMVVNAISEKVDAVQKTEQRNQEVSQAIAEAKKEHEKAKGTANAILEEAEAQAKANKLIIESLTPDLIKYKMIEAWDGQMPKITGGSDTLLNIDKLIE